MDLSREPSGKLTMLYFASLLNPWQDNIQSFVSYDFFFFFRGCWMDVWELMSQECRDEVVLIDSSCLLETLETYLRKHRYVKRAKTHLSFEEYLLHFSHESKCM